MIGDNIKRYRNLKSLSLRELASLVGVTQTSIAKYEKNEMIPDGERLLSLAEALSVTVPDLMKPSRTTRTLNIFYRKTSSLTAKKQGLLEMVVNDKVNNYLDVLDLLGEKPHILKRYSASNVAEAEESAKRFRLDNNLNELMPLFNLVSIVENLGINLVYLDDEEERFVGFDGVSQSIEGHTFICLRKNSNHFRQRFTLAHELGHLLLKMPMGIDEEEMCDAFASSILLPKGALIRKLGEKRDTIAWEEFVSIQKEYGVSIKSIIYGAHKHGIISDNKYKTYNIMFNKLSKDYEGKIESIEQTTKYKMLVYRLGEEGLITESRFQELLGGGDSCQSI